MSVTIRAKKCNDGSLKNHISHIDGVAVQWEEGIAVTDPKVWEAVKALPGYELIASDEDDKNLSDADNNEQNENDNKNDDIQSFENFCPLTKRDKVSKYEKFAKEHDINIDDANTKDEMMSKFEKFYNDKMKS